MEVAGRDNGYSDAERRAILLETIGGYRRAMREFAGMGSLDVWYSRLEVDELLNQIRKQFKQVAAQAGRKDARQGADERQHDRLLEADADGGRPTPDRV